MWHTAAELCQGATSLLQHVPGGAGTADHSIAVWNVDKQEAVAQWTGLKALNSALKWSPRRMLVASADSVLALWVPNKKLLQSAGRWQGP